MSKSEHSEVCKITLSGKVEVEPTTTMLTSVWQHDDYKLAQYVIWDLEACDAFPDFNEVFFDR